MQKEKTTRSLLHGMYSPNFHSATMMMISGNSLFSGFHSEFKFEKGVNMNKSCLTKDVRPLKKSHFKVKTMGASLVHIRKGNMKRTTQFLLGNTIPATRVPTGVSDESRFQKVPTRRIFLAYATIFKSRATGAP